MSAYRYPGNIHVIFHYHIITIVWPNQTIKIAELLSVKNAQKPLLLSVYHHKCNSIIDLSPRFFYNFHILRIWCPIFFSLIKVTTDDRARILGHPVRSSRYTWSVIIFCIFYLFILFLFYPGPLCVAWSMFKYFSHLKIKERKGLALGKKKNFKVGMNIVLKCEWR